MVAPVQQHRAVSIGNSVLVAGGLNGGATVSAAELYDPSNGLGCTSGTQCASGFCVNGVCCDTACNQGCGACNLAGKVGVCSAIASGTLCRGAAGPCDVPENCTGSSVSCPANTFVAGGTTCRGAAGECDLAEVCTGTSADCPPDAKKAAAAACGDDGNGCTSDQCDGTSDACGHPNACAGFQVCASNACCTPLSCAAAMRECGSVSDGCGGTLNCGSCPNTSHCSVAGQCVPDPSIGHAATGVDVCEELVEDLTIIVSQSGCNYPSITDCLNPLDPAPPECCIPGLPSNFCFVDPGCLAYQFIQQIEQTIKAGQIYCSADAFNAENFAEALVGGHIENLSNILANGTIPFSIDELYHLYLDILTEAGRNIPGNVQTIIADLVSPIYNNGATGFAFTDMQNVKIVSSDLPTASKLLPGGRLAITLGPVIVVRADLYNALTDPANAGITTNQLLNQSVVDTCCTEGSTVLCMSGGAQCTPSPDFLDGVDKMIHELVHVKQYRNLGQEGFLATYALSTIDYWAQHKADNVNSAFELEAYSYEAQIASVTGGNYCLSEKPYDDAQLSHFVPPGGPITCM